MRGGAHGRTRASRQRGGAAPASANCDATAHDVDPEGLQPETYLEDLFAQRRFTCTECVVARGVGSAARATCAAVPCKSMAFRLTHEHNAVHAGVASAAQAAGR